MKILSEVVLEDALTVLLKHYRMTDMEDFVESKETPSTNPMSVATLDSEIKQNKLALKLFQDGMRRKIASLCRRRNLLTPIYRLPPELLADIFQRVQSSEGNIVKGYSAIKILARVSSCWFATVLSTAYLWTRLDSMCRPEFTKSIIYRSKGLPFHLSSTQGGATITRESTFLDLVLPHLDRWQTFRNCSEHIMNLLGQLGEDVRIPSLQTFEASSSQYSWPEVPEVILHRAPSLHTLSIPSCTFPRGGLVFSTITKLKFTPVHAGKMLSSAHWQALLSNTLQLEFLHVVGQVHSNSEDPLVFYVVLPKLQTIILESLPVSLVGILISSICSPPQTCPLVEIRRTDRSVLQNEFGVLFPDSPQPQSLLSLIRTMTWMSVQCRSSRDTMFLEAGREQSKPTLVFHCFLPRSPSSVFETLVLSEGLLELESLSVYGVPLLNYDIFLQRLQCFPSLRKLSIGLPSTDILASRYHEIIAPIFNALSSPIPDKEITTKWLLPRLIELDVESAGGFKALLPFINSRRCRSINSPQGSNLPARLQVLRLQPLRGSFLDLEGPIEPKFIQQLYDMFEERNTELVIRPLKLG